MTTIKEAPQLGIFKIFTYKTNRFNKSCQADIKLSTDCYQAARNINFNQCEILRQLGYQARALRALGLLLADGAPTVGGGKSFCRVD